MGKVAQTGQNYSHADIQQTSSDMLHTNEVSDQFLIFDDQSTTEENITAKHKSPGCFTALDATQSTAHK